MKLSRRLISSEEHIEVASDLIDQGVFMMRSDVAQWIMTNTEDRDSIRGSLIPSLLKRQYLGTFMLRSLSFTVYLDSAETDIKSPFDCFALIDEKSTWRLDSLHNYVEAHRAIIASHLLKSKGLFSYQSDMSRHDIFYGHHSE